MGAAVTERRSGPIGTLEEGLACGQRTSGMEAVQRAEHAQAMVDGLGGRFGLFVELIAHLIEQSRFIHLKQRVRRML